MTTLQTDYAQADGTASLGTLTFNSGALAGKSYSIRQQTGGVFLLTVPVPVPPAAGDSITVYPGCDKQQNTCSAKFNNLQHFEGFPYVPVPETAA
jgi:uncharacterized phage protein (TIGR02218 family)